MNRRRKSRDNTRTCRKHPGLHATQGLPLGDRPPPGTIMWTWGSWVSAEPHVCRTLVIPTRAPSRLGSAAMVVTVWADAVTLSQLTRLEGKIILFFQRKFLTLIFKLCQINCLGLTKTPSNTSVVVSGFYRLKIVTILPSYRYR
jgi:hypothetical protein